MVFGDIAAALHYNLRPRALAELARRICGIHSISYFEDVAPLSPFALARQGLFTFAAW